MSPLVDSQEKYSTSLSIVIIAKNEGKNIARAIKSVLDATVNRPQTEILLVDSASTDETVEIARCYPINIVRLAPSWFHSVAAGRHIGMQYTKGELVLHVDGDMELDPEWVERSVPYILEHPDVAIIGGYWRDVYILGDKIIGEEDHRRDPQGRIIEEKFVNGIMLCRRKAIEQVGGFKPFIRGEEDIDLCLAVRHAGNKIIRLPYLTSRHFCIPEQSLAGGLRRLRKNLWLGYGQVPRYHWGTPIFWSYIRLRITTLLYFLGIFVSAIAILISLFTRNIVIFTSWLILVGFFILFLSIKKQGFVKALLSIFTQILIVISAIQGFVKAPRSSAEYPTNVEIVQMIKPKDCISSAVN